MTDIDNKPENGTKAKKLHVHKETLKDLGPSNPSQVKGGNRYNICTQAYSGCTQSGE
jgi:hypothetical protein